MTRLLSGLAIVFAASVAVAQVNPMPSRATKLKDQLKEVQAWVSGRTITIDEAVTVALIASRPYASAIDELEKARGKTDESRVALNPKAGLKGEITQLDKPVVVDFSGNNFVLTNQFNPVYTASISLPLDIMGASKAAISQSQFDEVAARIDVNRVRNQIVFDVRNAYFQALRAQGQLGVAQESLKNREQQLSDTEKNLAAGVASNFDIITAKRDVADAQQTLINTQAQITLTLANLKYVVGIDVSTNINISDKSALASPTPGNPTNLLGDLGPEYKQAVAEAVSNRPEVLESDASISAAEKGMVIARKSLLPDVSIFASYNWQPNAAAFTPQKQGAIGLVLSIPILDGGEAKAKKREAAADLDKATNNRRAAIDLVTLDVQQAFVNVAQAEAKITAATVGLDRAKEAYRMAKVRFTQGVTQTGVSPQLELSNAQTGLSQAQTNMVNALYDYNLARSQLDRAKGVYSYGVGPGFSQRPDSKVTGQVSGK